MGQPRRSAWLAAHTHEGLYASPIHAQTTGASLCLSHLRPGAAAVPARLYAAERETTRTELAAPHFRVLQNGISALGGGQGQATPKCAALAC